MKYLLIAAIALALVSCAQPGGSAATGEPTPVPSEPTAAQAPTPSPTAAPTSTARPTSTPPASPTAVPTSTPAPSVTPTPQLPQYVFPVRAEQVRYASAHHDYPAADIFCPTGSGFVAPTGGVVDFVSREDVWDPQSDRPADRGGISVAMIGDDGVRYYGSHLSEVAAGIEPGARVEAGQLLGLTGQSGNARGVEPHLHFGISRPTTPDDWETRRGEIPPYAYLRAWERGEPARPDLP